MNSVRCPKCRNRYEFSGLPPKMCPECQKKEDDQYNLVRNYVVNHRGTTVFEVAAATGVDEKKVLKYFKEGFFDSAGSKGIRRCDMCGKEILHGSICDRCKAKALFNK